MCLASLMLYLSGASAGLAALFPFLRRWRRRSHGAGAEHEARDLSPSEPL